MNPRGLEFLGALAGGLVHEIKNPLSTMRINLTLLGEDIEAVLPGERKLLRRIEVLGKEVARLDAILADFMRYAGMFELDCRPHDLGGLISDLVDFVGPGFARDGVRLTADVGALHANVDGPRFKQALLNLLLNAQHACPAGGNVSLRGWRDGERIRVEVRDDGCGIGDEELGKVFDVYYSGFGAGSGLGLPTARRILEEHGGGLSLESTPDKGTTVQIWLPGP